jgi:hypothetical protein
MSTYREIVDRLSQSVEAVSKDDRFPKRYILSVFQSKLENLLSQRLSNRSLFRESSPYTHISCVELEKIDSYKCDVVEFRSCNKIMKGVKKLPKIIENRYGPAVINVTNIDGSSEYKRTYPSKYRRDSKREGRTDDFYYIKNGYLYMPITSDIEPERVNMDVITLEPYLVQEVSTCEEKKCRSYWDYEITTSDKLTELAVQQALTELIGKRQIPVDENPNMDSNQKTQTIV